MNDSNAEEIPKCIGFIMDGNRRWAKQKNLPTVMGHRKGYEKFKEVMDWVKDAGIKNAVIYAFSTENWKRTEEEIGYLMDLFRGVLKNEIGELAKQGVRIQFLGEIERFPEDMQRLIQKAEEDTKNNTEHTLGIALSYGGRAEIVRAVNQAIENGNEVTEESFGSLLYTHDILDPDLIVRTSGEMRLSNFLPWQSVYSELFFTDTFWPDFSREEFNEILSLYGKRQRRKGS